jgi:hypothetical protein
MRAMSRSTRLAVSKQRHDDQIARKHWKNYNRLDTRLADKKDSFADSPLAVPPSGGKRRRWTQKKAG